MSACPMRPQPDRAADEIHMRRAIALSRKALGWASPNPAVGCVLVREGTGVGEGWTAPYGGPHAEVAALAAAREAARGATAYVTLAPCAHHGKTPPCTAALLAAGVARVVVAVDDPDPVSRDGVAVLRQAGVSVDLGCCDAEALDVLGGFVKTIATGLPLVRLKYAMTLDGRIASRTGHSRWVSGAEARAEVHRFRAESDAVLVGVGTVLADDPRLTARDAEGALDPASGQTWQPRRVVLDSHGRTPASACVFDCPGGEAVVVTTERIPDDRWAALASCGATILPCPERDGHVDAREAL
ncbi:MAG: bifunctional diaminohydroxyphosphoribosylaminopyrimidine deaminase/5-amino-6-(5-phosphoribosylamino)uracil reductase RibD, partial [Planctomycetota bacterium]